MHILENIPSGLLLRTVMIIALSWMVISNVESQEHIAVHLAGASTHHSPTPQPRERGLVTDYRVRQSLGSPLETGECLSLCLALSDL